MNSPLEALDTASAPDRHTFRPEFFRLSDPEDGRRLVELLKRAPHMIVHDELHGQLTELVRTLHPSRKFTKTELDQAAIAHLSGQEPRTYGVWVYYPWQNRLVHLLDETEFAQVRTDRNRNKITREEQAVLATKKVGVIGLSVGQSVCLTLALERSFGELRIADFDTLELSNLNRIRSGVHEMGHLKTVNLAREIAELDPFLKVSLYSAGVTPASMEPFLLEGGQLDILVDECDSVDVKIVARQYAKKLGIAVVMDMSDRGCLDVERFDLEPERPIMHGWIDHLDLEAAGRPMTNEEKIPFMLPIVGTDTLSPRMKASMVEMGQTLGTWPQLATSVVLGGALAGDTCRRILLDQFTASGRWYVDLEELIPSPSTKGRSSTLGDVVAAANATLPSPACSGPKPARPLSFDLALQLATAGAKAPSAGNMQPWMFHHIGGRLIIQHDRVRSAARWDPDHLLSHIALGACLENILLTGDTLGLALGWSLQEPLDGRPMAITVEDQRAPSNGMFDRLASRIGSRCTNRKVVERVEIPPAQLEVLAMVASTIEGCALHVFQHQEELNILARCCSGAERLRLLDEKGHAEFFEHELRWTAEEAHRKADGLDLATLELGANDAAALRIVSDPKAMALVKAWGGGKGLERFSDKAVRTASAVLLTSIPDVSLHSRIQGGRAAQRVWLEADRLGLAVHPISAPIFMAHAARLLEDVDPQTKSELFAIEERLLSLFELGDRRPLFMMRLTKAGDPSVRSVRRPIDLQFLSAEHTDH